MNDTSRLSILFCTAPAPFGGLETVVGALAEGFRARSHDVRITATVEDDPTDHPWLVPLSRDGIPVEPLVLPARAYIREIRMLSAVMRRTRPSLVHTHGFRSDVIAGIAARRLGLPIVSTAHGFTFGDLKNRGYEAFQRRVLRFFDAVVVVSPPLEAQLLARGVPRERLHLVPNALGQVPSQLSRREARQELGVPQEGFRIGWIGRLSAEKGPDVLIEALGMMAVEEVSASIVGSGPDLPLLQERASALGIADKVNWHGKVAQASRLLPAFDALVMSSRSEGTPMVLLEAMASRLPVVATAVGGIPAVISEAEALLVPSESPAELASAVRRVRDDPRGAAERADRAWQRLQRERGVEPWLDQYERIYRSIVRNSRDE